LNFTISPINKYTYNESVQLIQRFFKEFKGELINRVEAEQILKNPKNNTIVLTVEDNVRGLYVYEETSDIYIIKAFILHPLVRQKKIGYSLWKQMNEQLKDKPAIIGIVRKNKNINSIIKKRGHYIGSGLDADFDTIDYYNLTFKGK